MPVAKSYANLKQINEPFKKNGKMYVTVMTDTGKQRVVRWYSDTEYARMYPDIKIDKTKDPYYKPQKIVLGFEKGYITIFKGVTPENEEWFMHKKECRWAKHWGWYVISTEEVPEDLPIDVKAIKLTWEPMGDKDDRLRDSATVTKHVRETLLAAIRKPNPISAQQGRVGDRLELIVKVIGKQTEENVKYNSKTHLYELQDQKGNFYKWKTSAKDWEAGTKHLIRGTVKEFDEFNGEPCTVLTRCIEQKY
jgi:hypothetical protein